MRMRVVGLGALCVGVCFAVSAMAAGGGGQGPEEHGKGKPGRDPAARFAAADTNGDGVLSLEEFKAMQAKRQEMMKARLGDKYDAAKEAKRPSAEEMFKKLDTDNSGSLTKEELAAGRKQGRPHRGGAKPDDDAANADDDAAKAGSKDAE